MVIAYTTSEVEPKRRFDYWVDVVTRHCIPAASRPLKNEPFDGELAFKPVDAVDISKMSAPLHQWSRDAGHLRRSPDDDLWIGYLQQGQAIVTQGEREAHLGSGDMVLYDAIRPFGFRLEPQAIFLMRLSRHSLLQRCPKAEQLTARVINDSQPAAAPLRSMIEQGFAADFDNMRPKAAVQFGSTLLDLVAVTLEFQMDGFTDTIRERNLFSQVVSYIHRHFQNPELCLNDLANAHYVSTRTITRAFARHHQTPMHMLWQVRLEASRLALAEGRSRSVTEAALDHGFSNVSHFSRAFRKMFGCTPHTLIRN
jgi:AraC-like DNA-binding protein